MNKRNGYLDVAKFLFSIIIILYHFDLIFLGGYLVVEAFFMISGYFLMRSVKKADPDEPLGVSTGRFVLHKYRSIVYFLIPSAIIGCIAYVFIMPREPIDVLMQATLSIFEWIPLQVAGYTGFYTTGVSWYLSALLLASLIVYPLARKLKTTFTLIICPLVAIFYWGILSHNFGHINVPNEWLLGLFHTGMMRGIAGLCAGCFLYECVTRLENKKPSVSGRIALTLLEVLGWGYCLLIMTQYPKSMYDSAVLYVMFGLLLIGINQYSYLTVLVQFKWTKHLATISTVVYLNHYYWGQLIWKNFYTLPQTQQLLLYFGLIAASSLVVFFVGTAATRLIGRRKQTA